MFISDRLTGTISKWTKFPAGKGIHDTISEVTPTYREFKAVYIFSCNFYFLRSVGYYMVFQLQFRSSTALIYFSS